MKIMKKIALLLTLFTVGQYVKAQEDNSRVITVTAIKKPNKQQKVHDF